MSVLEKTLPKLLIVDDEPAILHAFRRALGNDELRLLTADCGDDAIAVAREQRPDVIILDVNLPDMSGLDVYASIRDHSTKTPVVFITGHGTAEMAIEATKRGAYDYLFKPLELDELRRVVHGALAVARAQSVAPVFNRDPSDWDGDTDILVGRSPAMNVIYKNIGRVAAQDVNVLITGESGTGKELVARAIYHHSQRANASFLPVNCAAIPDAILESELFGHERGAFTGASQTRIGKFEQCSGGTMFLDEVGDMSPTTQAKILRLLDEQRFERLGGNETIRTDVRLIAATNRNLEEMVAAGEFREDLYFRLSVFSIHLPPLRERGDDLRRLIEHFVRTFSRDLGKEVTDIPEATFAQLASHDWPGNVRELQSVLKQTLLRAASSVLLPEFLPPTLLPGAEQAPASNGNDEFQLQQWDRFIATRIEAGSGNLYEEAGRQTDRHLLMAVLRHTQGNQLQAARILGISRATLRTKLRLLQINVDEIRW